MNNIEQIWWFENQYGKTNVAINNKQITINHKGLTTFSLKKNRNNIILVTNIKNVVLKPPTFWQCGYLYIVLKNESFVTNDKEILLKDTCIALKRKSELLEARIIKSIINNLII